MPLFNKTKKEELKKEEVALAKKSAEAVELKSKQSSAPSSDSDLSWVIIEPRLSEKAIYAGDDNVYVFNVHKRANKKQVRGAIKDIYKVEPKKINITKIAKKNVRNQRTGIKGVKKGGKKAYVYLKDGDKISVV